MLTRCDGEEEEEDEGDDEGPERLLKGLTHQCSLTLHVRGLPTGFCRDIHGQVCVFLILTAQTFSSRCDRSPIKLDTTLNCDLRV